MLQGDDCLALEAISGKVIWPSWYIFKAMLMFKVDSCHMYMA